MGNLSVSQKLELSREIRQWIGIGFTFTGAAICVWMAVDPDGFEKTVNKIQKRIQKKKEDK